MKNLRLSVYRVDHKCIDLEGYWDGTWDETYEYIIRDDEGFEIEGMDGYLTEAKAREAGEKKLNELRNKYESTSKSNG